MAQFRLGVRNFLTKGAAVREIRRILNAATINERLMGDDHVLILALFTRHPDAITKAAGGCTGFMVRINSIEGALTRGFHIIHDDGATTAFSYLPCMNTKAGEPTLTVAARQAIIPSQRAIMREAFRNRETIPCATCGKELTRDKTHVHHTTPRFRDILAAYVNEFGEPKIVSAADIGDDFADPNQRWHWVAFHDARAVRVAVCAACNFAAG